MKTYNMDLRERVISTREEGYSAAATAKRFKISKRSVERYWKSYQQQGHCEPKQRGGYRRSRLEGHEKVLRKWIGSQPDLTLEQLQQYCLEKLKVKIGISGLWYRLDKLGLSYKKNSLRR